MNTFPAEHELVSLFEGQPELLDEGVPWAYNTLRFRAARGEDTLSCEIRPASEEFRIKWERSGAELVAVELYRVAGLVIEAEHGRETLVATFRDSRIGKLRLQVRPQVHLAWATDAE